LSPNPMAFSIFSYLFERDFVSAPVSLATVSVSISVSVPHSSNTDHFVPLKKKNARVIIGMNPFSYSDLGLHEILMVSAAVVSVSVSLYSIIDHFALLNKQNARVIKGMSPFSYSIMRFHKTLLCGFRLL